MLRPDVATVMALRLDVSHQIARRIQQLGVNQLAAARHLGIPQPTLSKVVNGRVSDLSLELLIRIAVLAGLPLTLQTGQIPAEAGAFVPGNSTRGSRAHPSALSEEARNALARSQRGLTPTQRLEAFLEHNQLIAELHAAGRRVETGRAGQAQRR
jgi:predicted XRE-type DNA-binding protein